MICMSIDTAISVGLFMIYFSSHQYQGIHGNCFISLFMYLDIMSHSSIKENRRTAVTLYILGLWIKCGKM